ncbi:hypothetical protein HMPREF3208_01214 [Gardnerella vaginalis]|uniref:Uncharacterized protein n=1 Tax=Gardnerella vaginalis TaxID=2702 RepID=A0A133NS25_GARVA|nr:hypothetical protein HMPREF3208_01214 [Gardnerella vaginalis]
MQNAVVPHLQSRYIYSNSHLFVIKIKKTDEQNCKKLFKFFYLNQ